MKTKIFSLFVGVISELIFLAPSLCAQITPDLEKDSQAAKIKDLELKVKQLENLVERLDKRLANQQPASPLTKQTDRIEVTVPLLPQPPSGLPSSVLPAALQEGTNPVPQDIPRIAVTDFGDTGKAPGSAGWDKGFFIKSADNQHTLRITGQIQTDYRSFQNDNDTTDTDTFLLRRARLGIEATVFNYYEFRFLPDFGGGKAVIQDSYLNIHYLDAFQFQAGKFKEPVSYEQLVQDRFVPTLERSLIDQIVPARDIGLMIHGQKLLGDQFDYAFGIFNGEINGGTTPPDSDSNKLRDFAARAVWRPLNYEALPEYLRLLQFGISGTTGVENETVSPLTLKTPGTVPFLTFNATVVENGLRTRITPEVSYFFRGLGVAGQWFRMNEDLRPVAGSKILVDVPFTGGYVMATYLLTGEGRTTYSAPVEPLRPFDPFHPLANPGAWETVVRFSHLDVSDVIFTPGAARLADPTKYSSRASELTLGFNWYLNSLFRMQFNWEHATFGDPVLLGPRTFFRSSDTLLTRLQIIF